MQQGYSNTSTTNPPFQAVSAGLVDSTSASRQGDPGSNPLAGTEICEVYPGLGILQTVESLPRLLLRHANILQCLALSMDEQYAV